MRLSGYEKLKPTFVVASQDFGLDLPILKSILGEFEKKAGVENAYEFCEKGQKITGWWFYEIYLKPNFMKKIVEIESPKKDERMVLEIMHTRLKDNKSEARIRLFKDKPFLMKWWTWLLR